MNRALIPPEDIRIGTGPFKDPRLYWEWGATTFQKLVEYGLSPDDTVLDMGCGCGRIAIHIAPFLSNQGRYAGFDDSREMVRWDHEHLVHRWPHIEFHFCDVQSGYDNPDGALRATGYRFPFEDDAFTFIFAESLFTHMFLADAKAYLAETARVLKPGGRFYATYLLLNAESREGIASGSAFRDFRFGFGESLAFDQVVPENGIAHHEDEIQQAYDTLGLNIFDLKYGNWSRGKEEFPTPFQDTIVAENSWARSGRSGRGRRTPNCTRRAC